MFVSKLKGMACLAALASLALAPACKKEGGGGGGVSKEAGAALNYIPKDAKIVGGMNLAGAANAKVLAKYKDKLLASAPPDFQEMQKACNIDVFTDIKSVVIGMVGKEKGVFVVSGNLKKDAIEKCLKDKAAKDGKTLEIKDDGKLRHYSDGGSDDLYVHWADGMVVAAPGEMGGKEMLNAVIGGEKLGDGDVMNIVKSTGTNATFWLAGVPDGEFTQGMPGSADMKSMALTINAGDSLDIKALVNFSSAEKAEEAETGARMGLSMASGHPMAKPFESIINKVKIELDGKALKAGISLTSEDLTKIESVAGMLGGM